MTTYYYRPSASPGGNGLSDAAAFDTIDDMPSGAHTHLFKRGERQVFSTIPARPTPADSSSKVGKVLSASIVLGAYGAGDEPAILTGAVRWTGSTSSEVVNGIPCTRIERAGWDPAWFPAVGSEATYLNRCAPTADDGVDSFMANPAALDDIMPDAAGVRFLPALNYGNGPPPSHTLLDATKEVSATDVGTGNTRYRVKIIKPGFWARANAVASLVGYNVVMRLGSNFTNYLGEILSYDEEEGSVVVGAPAWPSNGTQGLFFYALLGHPYGLRAPRQYYILPGNAGCSANLPSGDIEIACYGSVFYQSNDSTSFFDGDTVRVENLASFLNLSRAGCGILYDAGVDGGQNGHVIARNIRSYSREGAPVRAAGSGVIQNITFDAIELYECLGIKAFEYAPTGGGGGIEALGPIYSEGTGGGVRVAGFGDGPVLVSDFVICPRASIHDNHGNVYQRMMNVTLQNGVCCGAQNPMATQWDDSSGTIPPGPGVNRVFRNLWLSGLTGIDGARSANGILRVDDGLCDSSIDRVFSVYGGSSSFGSGAGAEPNTNLVVSRSVLDTVARSSTSDGNTWFSGTFRNCVFFGKSGQASAYSTTSEYIEAFGGTCIDCVDVPGSLFDGVITDDIWRCFTMNDTFDGYEAVPAFADQLGLTMPAYGSARTITKPAFVHQRFYTGHQAGLMYGTVINVNPLSTVEILAGAGDNDKLEPTLAGGINVIPSEACPDQNTFTIVLRVTDEGATNGPYQDFEYEIPIKRWLSNGTVYGPFTISAMDSTGPTPQTASLSPFFITEAA